MNSSFVLLSNPQQSKKKLGQNRKIRTCSGSIKNAYLSLFIFLWGPKGDEVCELFSPFTKE
jgi:hypothetical protein